MGSLGGVAAVPPAPSNIYLHNPLRLLTVHGSQNTSDSTSANALTGRGEDTSGQPKQVTMEMDTNISGPTPTSQASPTPLSGDTTTFFLKGSVAEQYIVDIDNMISTSKPRQGGGNETMATEDADPANSVSKPLVNPFQLLYSTTFQSYTSLAFYGALLTQLKSWVQKIDTCPAQHRSIVWQHLFIIVGVDQSSSDAFAPVLQAILAPQKMNLLEIEVLYISFLLSLRLYPTLLSSSSSSTNKQNTEKNHTVDSKADNEVDNDNTSSNSHNSNASNGSSLDTSKQPLDPTDASLKSTNVRNSHSSDITSSRDSLRSEMEIHDPKTEKSDFNDESTNKSITDTNKNLEANKNDEKQMETNKSIDTSKLIGGTIKNVDLAVGSVLIELTKQNAVGFSSQFRLCCSMMFSDSLTLCLLPRARLGITAPTVQQYELNQLLSVKHLAILQLWAPVLDSLPLPFLSQIWDAVQNVTALKILHTTGTPFSLMIKDWDASPKKHLTAISALYNTIMMLLSVNVLNVKDFDVSTSAAIVNEKMAAYLQTTVPQATPVWGSSPVVDWSPVPSPLTTYAVPFMSPSPLNFAGPLTRPSPIARSRPGSTAGVYSTPSPLNMEPTFAKTIPSGALAPLRSHAPLPHALPTTDDGSIFQGLRSNGSSTPPEGATTAFRSKSAFGALKRVADIEAEGAPLPKRTKLE